MQADTWSSPYWVDGKVYLGNESGDMLIFEHGKTKKLLNTVTMSGMIRATPVAVNGVAVRRDRKPVQAVRHHARREVTIRRAGRVNALILESGR